MPHNLSRYANLNVKNYCEGQCLAPNKYNVVLLLLREIKGNEHTVMNVFSVCPSSELTYS